MLKPLLFFLLTVAVTAQAQHEAVVMENVKSQLLMSAQYRQPAAYSNSKRLLKIYSDSIAAGRDVAGYTYARALTYLSLKDYDKALPLLEKACQLKPTFHGYTGWVYLDNLRDYPRTLAHYNTYDALTPDSTIDDREGDYSVRYLKVQIYRFMGEHKRALPLYDFAISVIEDKHGPAWVSYRCYVARGQSRLAVGRAGDALSDFEKAIPNNPSSALSSYWKCRALQVLNRSAEARIAYNDALLWLRNSSVEHEQYYEHQDSVCTQQIETALASL